MEPDRADRRPIGGAALARLLGDLAADYPIVPLSDEELEAPIEFRDPDAAPAIEGYDLGVEAGRGGQGVVYRATERASGRDVAVKVLPGGHFSHPEHRSRFLKEARILARLRCPGVVRTLHHGRTTDGSLYMVLPFVDGPPLDRYAAALAGDDAAVAELFALVADAAAAVHAAGVVHRDIKPSNVRVGPDGRPQLLDFGLAGSGVIGDASRCLTSDGRVLGTLEWSSPEQASGDVAAVDARSDVYAIGVMLCEAIAAGHAPPYPVRGTPREVTDHILATRPAVAGRSPADPLAAVALRCMAKRPADRYQTAADLAADLRRVAGGGLPATRPGRLGSGLLASACAAALAVATIAVLGRAPLGGHDAQTPSAAVSSSWLGDRAHEEFAWVAVGDGATACVARGPASAAAVASEFADGRPAGNGPAVVTRSDAERYCALIRTARVSYRLPTAAEARWMADHGAAGRIGPRGGTPAADEWSSEAADDGASRPFRVIAVPH